MKKQQASAQFKTMSVLIVSYASVGKYAATTALCLEVDHN